MYMQLARQLKIYGTVHETVDILLALKTRNSYYSVTLSREVFFVSDAKRKSQKIRGLPARNYAECIISVHREACYCSQPYGL